MGTDYGYKPFPNQDMAKTAVRKGFVMKICYLSKLAERTVFEGSLRSVKQVGRDSGLVSVLYQADYPNGYGVSILQAINTTLDEYTSDSAKGCPWELAVMKDGEPFYGTDITNDIRGYLTEEEVLSLVREIRSFG